MNYLFKIAPDFAEQWGLASVRIRKDQIKSIEPSSSDWKTAQITVKPSESVTFKRQGEGGSVFRMTPAQPIPIQGNVYTVRKKLDI